MLHHIKILSATDRLAENIISYETSCGIIGGKTIGADIARGLENVTCEKCRAAVLGFWPQLRKRPPWVKADDNRLKVTVSGPTGSGKSSVAWLIKNALETRGFKVDFTDDDRPEAFFHVEKRLDALVQCNASISVQTNQTERELCESPKSE